ncbi:MAG: hypothetical protein EBR82_08125 [Caulobacteraceae bacterium]|nr:hypothetical protein [Caulobacteraceae bacterium]
MPAARADATAMVFDRHVASISEGLLSADEEGGIIAVLPRLWALAEEMRVIDKPIADWEREELLRFLTLAIRSAVPLRHINYLSPDMNDAIPF